MTIIHSNCSWRFVIKTHTMVSNYLLSCALNKIEQNQISNRHYFRFSIVALKFNAFPHMKNIVKGKQTNIPSFSGKMNIICVKSLWFILKGISANRSIYMLHFIYTGVILEFHGTPVKKVTLWCFSDVYILFADSFL